MEDGKDSFKWAPPLINSKTGKTFVFPRDEEVAPPFSVSGEKKEGGVPDHASDVQEEGPLFVD